LKKFDANKLFYGKYPYKLSLSTPLANWFRGGDLPYIRDTLDELQHQYNQNNRLVLHLWNRVVYIKTSDLYYAQKVYSHLCTGDSYRLRVEGRSLDVYSDNKDWLENLLLSVDPIASEWWEPKHILQPNTIIMGPSMKGWEYRITMGSDIPAEFYAWMLNNLDKVKVGPKFKDALLRGYRYMYGYYFYVKNDRILSLVSLVLGKGISKIDKIVIEDKNA
jgi:hypothetical protein